MAISISTDQVDENQREQLSYGTPDFPIAFFYDDLTRVRVPWHWHEEFEIVVVLQGSVRVSIAGIQSVFGPGEGYFANSGVLHSADLLTETGRQHAMVFGPHLLAGDNDIFRTRYVQPLLDRSDISFVRLTPGIPWTRNILDLAEKTWKAGAYEEEDYPLTVRDGLCRIFSLILKNFSIQQSENAVASLSQREEQRVKKALRFIETHCGEPLTIDDIAGSADISVSACLRCFHNVLHTTPIQYLRKYRLEQAAAALARQDGRTVTALAAAYGFTDMSYFDRCFRREFGMKPSDYRCINSNTDQIF